MNEEASQPEIQPIAPYQQRVIDEKADLDARLSKLAAFIDGNGEIYLGLSVSERHRLNEQRYFMTQYANVLAARIEAFQS